MGVDYIDMRRHKKGNPLLIHNASFTCLQLKPEASWSTEFEDRIEYYLLETLHLQKLFSVHMQSFGTPHLCWCSKSLPLRLFIKGYGIYIFLRFHFLSG